MAVIEELAKRSTAIACSYIMGVCYAGMNLVESGSEAQRADLLPRLVREGAAEVTQACMRVAGAYGLSDSFDFERYTRDAVSLPIVGGSSNMQKNNIANRLRLES